MASVLTTIPLRRSTKSRLKALVREGETYDKALRRVLEQAELASHLETHYERLRDKSRFVPLEEI